tara:strand:- start:303 stop:473 length:171 start_codon:yes stop_codon:yes gene_type:complete
MKTNELLYQAFDKRYQELKPITDARCLLGVLKREFNLSSNEVAELLGLKNNSENER